MVVDWSKGHFLFSLFFLSFNGVACRLMFVLIKKIDDELMIMFDGQCLTLNLLYLLILNDEHEWLTSNLNEVC